MNFLCIYLGEGRGGVALMHVYIYIYIGTHSQPLLQNHWMDFDETWYGWSTQWHGLLHVKRHFGQIHPGEDPGRGQNRSWGSPSSKYFSSGRKATATNQMYSIDLEACRKKCCYFWFHSEVKFFARGRGGGSALKILNACMYVWELTVSLYYKTSWWIFANLVIGMKQYGYLTIWYISRYRGHDTIGIAIRFQHRIK